MDLETEICADTRTSLAYIPYKTPFTPISLHICSKFSGQVASFRDEEEFGAITRFLSRWERCGWCQVPGPRMWLLLAASRPLRTATPPCRGSGWRTTTRRRGWVGEGGEAYSF